MYKLCFNNCFFGSLSGAQVITPQVIGFSSLMKLASYRLNQSLHKGTLKFNNWILSLA